MSSPLDRLAVWAVRYALGRSTYAVGDVCDTLSVHRLELSAETRAVIVADIDEAIKRGPGALGMAMDAQMWRALRARLA